MHDHDLVIRGGTVVDGRGGEPFVADVAVSDGKITEVGAVAGRGRQEIDARGLMVTPGFIDIHTHYDGQLTWDDRTAPSSQHGVTTIVTGNCGVGFAPCRPEDREILLNLMEGIEDVPELVMAEGLPWDWESFPEFLDRVEAHRRDVDVACQLPHSCLRVNVMGARGARGEPATESDLAEMARLAEEAIRAGAIGFGTSRTVFHRGADGTPVPTRHAAEAELDAIASGIQAAGQGVLQSVVDGADADHLEAEVRLLGRVAAKSGRPVSYTLLQNPQLPEGFRRALAINDELQAKGVAIKAQVFGRAQGVLMGFELSYHPFVNYPTYRRIADLPLEERIERLRDPELKKRILAEKAEKEGPTGDEYLARFDKMFELGDPPQYEQPEENSVEARAARAGVSSAELVYDLLLKNGGRNIIQVSFMNYSAGNLDEVREMLVDPTTIYGLGDGGAHYGLLCDANHPTFLLTHWTRDRQRRNMIDVASVVKGLTLDCAAAVELNDRGVIAPGYKADLNVIDYDKLRLRAPRVLYDLPAGGKRIVQDAEGYAATIVNGVITQRDGKPTDALPGKLVRGAQPAPRMAA